MLRHMMGKTLHGGPFAGRIIKLKHDDALRCEIPTKRGGMLAVYQRDDADAPFNFVGLEPAQPEGAK